MSTTITTLEQSSSNSHARHTYYPSTSTAVRGTGSKSIPTLSSPDVERTNSVRDAGNDPYQFKGAVKTDGELDELRKRSRKGKQVAKYHKNQNELIGKLLKPMEEHTADAQEAEDAARTPVKIAVYASFGANFALCVLQIFATVSSGSLSILATGVDSVFDIGANFILGWFHRKAGRLDHNKWPVGGDRLETIGNIVYGSLMASVNLVVVVECVRTLAEATKELDFNLAAIVSVGVALGVKLLLFLYCYTLRKSSSQVMMLWSDHRNDLWVNSFAILMSAGGAKLRWWLDPLGGLIIALGIIISWTRTIYREFELLAGKSAPHEFMQLVIYKVMTFSDEISGVDTVRAYHSGPDYFVEIDIVMPGDTPLWRAHDLSQQLQDKLETLPGVGRAFVHVDHETTHTPEHRKNK